ncbi:MAG: hypothetical protein U9R16_00065 [Campylobacterota bacterium]|nr:hypothetical protein [Campylobacterota bacterium]
MSKLIHAIFVKDEAHCIDTMLDSILPYVDDSYIMVDDRTTDNTKEIVEDRGCHTKMFTFSNFSKTKNTLLKWVTDKTDWIIGIAPDETIRSDFGEMLRTLVDKLELSTYDCVRFPRRHWKDLEMKNEYTCQHWYPDFQARLLRADYPRIHMINYVHEIVQGVRKTLQVNDFDIHHFNIYYKARINYDWGAMNKLYNELKIRHRREGGRDIWPNEDD